MFTSISSFYALFFATIYLSVRVHADSVDRPAITPRGLHLAPNFGGAADMTPGPRHRVPDFGGAADKTVPRITQAAAPSTSSPPKATTVKKCEHADYGGRPCQNNFKVTLGNNGLPPRPTNGIF